MLRGPQRGRPIWTSLTRAKGVAWFAVPVVVAEAVGRSFTHRIDLWLHVVPLARSHADYYPFLLVAVKIVCAIGLAALLARMIRLRASTEAGERLLAAAGHHGTFHLPRFRTTISPRAWLASFLAMSVAYLVQMNVERTSARHLPGFAPWLHTYALPVYAVLAVLVALVWGMRRWLRDVEEYAVSTLDRARRILRARSGRARVRPHPADELQPRRRFGLSLDSRPPPLPA
jgi:hypothetical protein